MQVGDRPGGRYRILGSAPSRDAIERWRAVDEATAEPVEVLQLGASRASREARRAFREVHQALAGTAEPRIVSSVHVHHDERETWVVRRPLEDATLADLRGPLDAGRVAAIGAMLLPAVLAAGGATRGALLPADVGLDEAGHPVLAPRGAPLTRVLRGTSRAAAPEAFAGRSPDGPAGLYGLGVLLYRLATGREPMTGAPGQAALPPPPSSLRHGLPVALDQAILRLLSEDPGARAGALPLLQELATEVGDLRQEARAGAVTGNVRTTRSTPHAPSAREDRDPAGLVLIPADDLATLDPRGRSTAAGLARVPVSVLDGLVAGKLPLVLDVPGSRAAARLQARELRDTTGLPATHGTRGGPSPWLPLSAAVVASLVPLLAMFAFLAMGLLPVAIAAFVVLLVVAAGGGWLARSASARQALHRAGVESLTRVRAETVARSASGILTPAWERLAELRIQLGHAELPDAAAADLRGALKDLEERLEGLGRVAATAERALQQVDGAALRTRMAALDTRAARDPAARSERDRLARTVADLDAVEARKDRIAEESVRVRDALSEIAAVLGQVGEEPDDDALRRIGDVARGAGAAALEPEALDPRLERARRALAQREGPG